jgi:hypothetical protein
MTKLERYLNARLINLKNSLSETNPFEESSLYFAIDTAIREIQMALDINTKDVVYNRRSEAFIIDEENLNAISEEKKATEARQEDMWWENERQAQFKHDENFN